MPNYMKEICKNCGFTYGSHLANKYYSNMYRQEFPKNCCPGHEGRMDWNAGPGTIFEPTGTYKEEVKGNA